ncbi:MAG: SufS family cysteine desulfurase [Acidimicrobiia bacterium]
MDLSHVKADFPILQRDIRGRRLVYLDSASSSHKPEQVIEAMDAFQRSHYANVHRGAYLLAEEATEAYEEARGLVAAFIGAGSAAELVFTRGTTTAMNTVVFGWGLHHLKPGDQVMLTTMEHHANIVPWHLLMRLRHIELVYVPFTEDYRLDIEALEDLLTEQVKVVSFTGMSNVLGTQPPTEEIARLAKQVGALVVVDAAQLVPHAPVDVQDLGIDLLAFSSHKMFGPTGVGALWGRKEILEEMEPFEGGGEMISDVKLFESKWAPVPQKFEAGTPPITEAVGFGAAVEYLDKVGMDVVAEHDQELTAYALERLAEVPGLTIYGPRKAEARGGAISMAMEEVHAHDLATILDEEGVAVRAGHHCAKPLMAELGVLATARASFHIYNTPEDVDVLISALHRARAIFGLS